MKRHHLFIIALNLVLGLTLAGAVLAYGHVSSLELKSPAGTLTMAPHAK